MSLGHTLRATCGTLPSNEDELQNVVGPHALEQRAVRYFAMRINSLLTSQSLGKQRTVLSRYLLAS